MTRDEFERSLLELWMKSSIPLTRANLQYRTGESARGVKQHLEALMRDGVVEAGSDGADLVWSVPGAQRAANGPRSFDELERFERLSLEVRADSDLKQARARKLEEEARQRRLESRADERAMVVARKADKKLARKADNELARRSEATAIPAVADEAEGGKRRGFLARIFGRDRFDAGDALEVATQARRELEQPKEPKKKSLLWSGGLSFFLGPLGWLYAGSFREGVPASAIYLFAAALLSKLPLTLVGPVFGVAMPISALIGVGYAWQFNKKGKRQRLLTDGKKKELEP